MQSGVPQVKQERTGWRDLELSLRHRKWGWDLPAVDLDFLFLEYDRGKAVAIVEYKHEHATPQHATHPTYQAMIDLGTRASIPVFACRYKSDFTQWNIVPLNNEAKEWMPNGRMLLTERQWVTFLYKIRGYDLPQAIFNYENLVL